MRHVDAAFGHALEGAECEQVVRACDRGKGDTGVEQRSGSVGASLAGERGSNDQPLVAVDSRGREPAPVALEAVPAHEQGGRSGKVRDLAMPEARQGQHHRRHAGGVVDAHLRLTAGVGGQVHDCRPLRPQRGEMPVQQLASARVVEAAAREDRRGGPHRPEEPDHLGLARNVALQLQVITR